MKVKMLAVLIASLFATAAVAQSTTDKPSSHDKATSSDKMHAPTAEERAKNREAVSDSAITGKVKTALATDVGLKTVTGINVDTDNNGVVTLSGKVNSADQKKRAADVAKKVSGVKSVKNNLTVEKKS